MVCFARVVPDAATLEPFAAQLALCRDAVQRRAPHAAALLHPGWQGAAAALVTILRLDEAEAAADGQYCPRLPDPCRAWAAPGAADDGALPAAAGLVVHAVLFYARWVAAKKAEEGDGVRAGLLFRDQMDPGEVPPCLRAQLLRYVRSKLRAAAAPGHVPRVYVDPVCSGAPWEGIVTRLGGHLARIPSEADVCVSPSGGPDEALPPFVASVTAPLPPLPASPPAECCVAACWEGGARVHFRNAPASYDVQVAPADGMTASALAAVAGAGVWEPSRGAASGSPVPVPWLAVPAPAGRRAHVAVSVWWLVWSAYYREWCDPCDFAARDSAERQDWHGHLAADSSSEDDGDGVLGAPLWAERAAPRYLGAAAPAQRERAASPTDTARWVPHPHWCLVHSLCPAVAVDGHAAQVVSTAAGWTALVQLPHARAAPSASGGERPRQVPAAGAAVPARPPCAAFFARGVVHPFEYATCIPQLRELAASGALWGPAAGGGATSDVEYVAVRDALVDMAPPPGGVERAAAAVAGRCGCRVEVACAVGCFLQEWGIIQSLPSVPAAAKADRLLEYAAFASGCTGPAASGSKAGAAAGVLELAERIRTYAETTLAPELHAVLREVPRASCGVADMQAACDTARGVAAATLGAYGAQAALLAARDTAGLEELLCTLLSLQRQRVAVLRGALATAEAACGDEMRAAQERELRVVAATTDLHGSSHRATSHE